MTAILTRLFVKNYDEVDNPQVREQYGRLAGLVGVFCNLLLFASKLVIGTISHSVSITADAVNNLSDASSSVVTLVGFRLSQKPADDEHPFGHARFEYLSGLVVTALIIVIGYQLARSSIEKIIHPTQVKFSVALVIVLLLSIAVKLWMALFNGRIGKKISSLTLKASAEDSRNDVITTSAVLLAAVITKIIGFNLDGYIGLLVALFILYSGIQMAKDTISPLLGESASPELAKEIADTIMTYDEKILGIHDLMVHDYGPGQRFASIHVEVDSRNDPLEMHDMIDNIERMFQEEKHIQLVIHYDPVVTDDEELNRVKEELEGALSQIDGRLMLHDFRMVKGNTHTNLIFDVCVPHDLMGQEKEIKKCLDERVQNENVKYFTVITFDSMGFNTFSEER